jgi:glycosyltransferase involved in cell wall biosynthesis
VNTPQVSVICLCYNHSRFVEEAVQSVLHQTYTNVQLILVDDRSTDDSPAILQRIASARPEIKLIQLESNLGNCRAFNRGFAIATGAYIIDLSADDVLEPARVSRGVEVLESAGPETGVHFCDAQWIDEKGTRAGLHSDRYPHHTIPQGDVYAEVLRRYFINSPTMMSRRSVFDRLGGYDETLAYEDFDFWVRSSREFLYIYTPEVLVKRRRVAGSLGQTQFNRGSQQMVSTLRVLEKAFSLNREPAEHHAWKIRVRYEMRRAIQVGALSIARRYWKML